MRAALLLALLALEACGSTCKDIADDRARFARREILAHGPDARLSVPFDILDGAIASHLAERPPVRFALPVPLLGQDIALSARLDGVHARMAGSGRVGVTIDVGLYEGDDELVEVTLETAVIPVYRAGDDHLELRLNATDLGDLEPHLTSGSRIRLASWLRSKLPRAARVFATDDLTGLAAEQLLDVFADEIWPRIKGPLLGSRDLFATSLALPDLPLADVGVRSTAHALIVDLTTRLPGATSTLSDDDERKSQHARLRIAGPSAAALVNEAMDRGLAPARFTAAGKPALDGAYEARVSWVDGGRPLRVHLWQSDPARGKCQSAIVSGELKAHVERDELVVDFVDGSVGSVRGEAMTEAFAWLVSLWSDAIELAFRVASVVSFEADGQPITLRVHDVAVEAHGLTIDLEASLRPASPDRRSPSRSP